MWRILRTTPCWCCGRFQRSGYRPTHLRVEGREALRKALRQDHWDAVIADHNLPAFSSIEALVEVKRIGKDLPFIIVSGSIGEDVAVTAMKSGAHDYIMKDNLARLVPAVERELGEAAVRRARARLEVDMHHLETHDALTGLVNRALFERRLTEVLATPCEGDRCHAVFNVDLDHFKLVNDTCGHSVGDELLRGMGLLIQSRLRPTDLVARIGGDEFACLLSDCTRDEARKTVAEVRDAVKQYRFSREDDTSGVSASIGLAVADAPIVSAEQVMRAADLSTALAKELGGNRIHVYSEADQALSQRYGEMLWVSRIEKALKEDRFLLYWQQIQPLGNPADSRPHAEFLIRLKDTDGQVVPPGDFIPAAERYNLMPKLDRWVIQTAFEYLARAFPCREGEDPGQFSINLSGASLGDATLFDFIREQLRRYSLSAGMICFEVTETAAIRHLPMVTRLIAQLREEGFRFALDDFGCGLSSFAYLRALPVDFIKIDGSFVRTMLLDPMNYAIVESIHRIGHQAGLKTVAEFVESEAVLQELERIGIDFAQGFGVARPLPVPEPGMKASFADAC